MRGDTSAHHLRQRAADQHKFSPADIDEVIVRQRGLGGFVAKPFEARRYPHCDANFSIQFQVANVLLNGITRQEHNAEAWIRSEQITDLVKKVSLTAMPPDEKGLTIEVVLKDRRNLVEEAPPTYYDPKVGPSSYETIVAKFRQQVAFSGLVSRDTADEIIRRVDNLEHEASMADFVQLLTRSFLPAPRST